MKDVFGSRRLALVMAAPSSQKPRCVSQPSRAEKLGEANIRIGTFNVGVVQTQILGQKFEKPGSGGLDNLRRIVAKTFEEGDLNLLTLCEVGGHKLGLGKSPYDAICLLEKTLEQGEFGVSAPQNYVSIWHKHGASQRGGVSLRHIEEEVIDLDRLITSEPQLVLTTYAVTTNASAAEGFLLVGQLHIRIPSAGTHPNISTRKSVVKKALEQIMRKAKSSAFQPAVSVLCGDVNLDRDNADACCQADHGDPDVSTHWYTQTSSAARSGDVAFVRGCPSEAFDISVGASYSDRGMRKDCHDCFGITVSVPLFGSASVPQPGVDDASAVVVPLGSASVPQPGVDDVAENALKEMSVRRGRERSQRNERLVCRACR